MLRMIQSAEPEAAKKYFGQTGEKAAYYAQELPGQWGGKLAKRLSLEGTVARADFDALCENRTPGSGAPLTLRTNKTKRTVGYDLNFHAPKSLTLLYELGGGQEVLGLFQQSVRETMRHIERDAQARVRKGGKDENRSTGNLAWAEYVHFTSRPVDGAPDPHLHAHCFVFNATFDPVEGACKAGQFREINRDMPYYQAWFHAALARRLAEAGYPVERTENGWEIAGISRATIDKFSRRSQIVEAAARAAGVTDAAEKNRLGARTRERKNTAQGMEELRGLWRGRLTPAEGDTIAAAGRGEALAQAPGLSAEAAFEQALAHHFERAAVVSERRLLATALELTAGTCAPEAVERVCRAHPELVRKSVGGRAMATTREALRLERELVARVRRGRGALRPLYAPGTHAFRDERLSEEQQRAVETLLGSTDRFTLLEGKAGVGKSTLLRELGLALEARGKTVFALAPTAQASRVGLREDGFSGAETLAMFLKNPEARAGLEGQVVLLDEAGLAGARDLRALFALAEQAGARVVLSGDTGQHKAVERGGVLHTLKKAAGLQAVEVREIRRQRGTYKQAVRHISRGEPDKAFGLLDQMGAIREVGGEARYQELTRAYAEAAARGESALVVAPTHREGERVTSSVRAALAEAGLLSGKARTIARLRPLSWTQAEKSDIVNYRAGLVAQFTQNAKGGFVRGARLTVLGPGKTAETLRVRDGAGRESDFSPGALAGRFEVYEAGELELRKGDRVRLTQNGRTADRQSRLHNGAAYAVKGFDRAGNIVLDNGFVVAQDYGHLTYGYCATSHAAQGKTVDRVIIAQSALSAGASSLEQFYVSVSRGRKGVEIYTDCRATLLERVSRAEPRLSALELAERGGFERRRERPRQRRAREAERARGG